VVTITSADETYVGTLTLANKASREAAPQLRAVPAPPPANAQSTIPSFRRSPSPPPPPPPELGPDSQTSAMELFPSQLDVSEIQNGIAGILPQDTADIPMDDQTHGPPLNPPSPVVTRQIKKKRSRSLMFPNAGRPPPPKKPASASQLILLSDSSDEN